MKAAVYILLLFFLASCTDKCKDIFCKNGGECEEGECICPSHYTGSSCDVQETPSRVTIISVKVTKWPEFDNGESWDDFDGPDVRFMVQNSAGVIYEHNDAIDNIEKTGICSFEGLSIPLSSLSEEHTFFLLDDDGTVYDLMANLKFKPYTKNNKFSEEMELKEEGTEVTLGLSYEF